MDLGLKGKRALVTGSTAGIGLATARALAAEGAHVIVNGRTDARVAPVVDRLKREIPGAVVGGIAADLSSAQGCRALLAEIPNVDVLVNNMGIFESKPFEQIADEDWMRFFETNVLSGSDWRATTSAACGRAAGAASSSYRATRRCRFRPT
jgi:NAD(P)-dependent dehydrogenase (short-subunit alcohol dehydrogenase family)